MFGNKKKKNTKIVNSVFGELEYKNSFWYGTTQITLWNHTFDIKVFPITNSKMESITPKQEIAYSYYKENIFEIQQQIEEFLQKSCKPEENNTLWERYEPSELVFDLNGGFGLEIYDNVTEDEYDADFVVVILPELKIDTTDHYMSNAICDVYVDD